MTDQDRRNAHHQQEAAKDAKSSSVRGLGAGQFYDGGVCGDCIACDNYVLDAADAPYCSTCARLLREGKPL